MKYSYSDTFTICSLEDYINQYNPIRLELDKVYVQKESFGGQRKYKIVAIHGDIAMGVEVTHNCLGTQDYCLFYVQNGFKYEDYARPSYRLYKEDTKD